MKKITSIIAIVALSIAFSTTASAQVTATATATATIVAPISIVKDVDMNFGNFATTPAAGTIILAPAGTRTFTGGVTLPATIGTVTAAKFTVSGQTSYAYTITIPIADINLTHTDGTTTMTLGAFTSSILTTAGAGALSSDTVGVQTFYVGATLTVADSQLAGLYTTISPFSVTVNYN